VVGDPHVRFYAGMPLRSSDGHAVGMLCVKDTVPRDLSPAQLDALRVLGRQVVTQLELRQHVRKLEGIIAERSRMELALRESEIRHRAILETALDGIIVMDDTGRIREFNPAAEQIFGHRRDEVLGRDLADVIIPPSWRERHRRGLAHYLATGEATILDTRVEVTALHASGSEFPAELAISRIQLDGPPVFTAYLRDIGARKRAEEEQQRLRDEIIRTQAATLAELSTPLIPISDDVLVMPLIGAVDSRRAQQVVQALLQGIAGSQVQFAILDITGVAVVATEVANALIRAASSPVVPSKAASPTPGVRGPAVFPALIIGCSAASAPHLCDSMCRSSSCGYPQRAQRRTSGRHGAAVWAGTRAPPLRAWRHCTPCPPSWRCWRCSLDSLPVPFLCAVP
jgi:PAS domain S-box-containing protein